ncbi:phosphoribosylamine--glycine ligase [Oceanicella actignis]|uniref:Phosphoribosylamine--glycine ligase n=1 Tax=Oceanicella actignis TaxID=1189325 RepID=A0A1M7ST03_9RHOB|nr:phosphoribosylamine--glycine ligase [Oceanicella actignis]SES69688.1 phosphoribosylamine--glycine ligase [Oceanicella actignis]SHN61677.1 phosphoribosylamine--glycine ligase [Oceanicella actignis]
MNILILGGGGREHALAWAIARSPDCGKLICAPGNAGIAAVARCVPADIENPAAVIALCRAEEIDFVVIGPEAPLAAGVSDALREAGIAAFGPSRAAAQLEASKTFAKQICDACGAPTAAWARFEDPEAAKAHVRASGAPIVIKADGLAAGKGVVVAATEDEALAAIDEMFAGAFGAAGAAVVIEEFMPGEEASLFVLTDGEHVLPLPGAQDHKRAFDGDKGPNTGGMGAYSPAPALTPEIERRAIDEIVLPTIREMARRGAPYRGVLYAGLMIGPSGPRLVEYNARFGDPECQVLMMRLAGDILPALRACAEGGLEGVRLDWRPEPALTVVMAAKGYPGAYAKGEEIRGLEAAAADPDVEIFHAGTRAENGRILSNGGRVLNVTARGATLAEARAKAYEAIARIDWPGGFCRSDIGWRALSR